jgi:hypothetical protein
MQRRWPATWLHHTDKLYLFAIFDDFRSYWGRVRNVLQHTDDNAIMFKKSLEIMIARTSVDRYRHLCSDANTLPAPNDRDTWRRWIIDEAHRDPTLPDITASLAEAAGQPRRVNPCGSPCP